MTSTDQVRPASMPTSRKVLCAVYGLIAVAALIATWSQTITYATGGPTAFFVDFWQDAKVTASSRNITADILMFCLSAAVLMVIEARKHGVRFVWLYILGGFLIAVSVTFPLFLIAREMRVGASNPPHLHTFDAALLAVLAAGLTGLTIWIDMG